FGPEGNVFDEEPEHAFRVITATPVLSTNKLAALVDSESDHHMPSIELSLQYDPEQTGLKAAIESICDQAEAAARDNISLIILTDRYIEKNKLPIHALMATGAVHHRLVKTGLRCKTNIIAQTATARDSHQFACLIGYGATAIHPYLSYRVLRNLVDNGEILMEPWEAMKNYRKGINKGLQKILSKMGISAVVSYRGAQLFEAVGLNDEVIDLCFDGTPSRIKGADFTDFEEDARKLAKLAWTARKPINPGGLLKFVYGQEYHAFNPDVIQYMHDAVRSGDFKDWQKYADTVNQRPVATLRDLLRFKPGLQEIPLDEVEPIESIVKRFDSAGMSLGALSPEAHEALA
ncbi:MAG: glutamate synthase central domain-containing protein, partial [Pseudomonadales bacterium]